MAASTGNANTEIQIRKQNCIIRQLEWNSRTEKRPKQSIHVFIMYNAYFRFETEVLENSWWRIMNGHRTHSIHETIRYIYEHNMHLSLSQELWHTARNSFGLVKDISITMSSTTDSTFFDTLIIDSNYNQTFMEIIYYEFHKLRNITV